MSEFIGPVHYWLYGKIRLVTWREEYIYQQALEMCGDTAEEIKEQVWQTYGEPLPDIELGELVDHDNIHGWLQRQINIVESREAAFIKELRSMCGTAANALVERAFAEHGKMTGETAKAAAKYDVDTAPGIYKALNDYYFNGMPCDQADKVVAANADSIIWDSTAGNKEDNWKRAGIDSKTMTNFYRAWLTAFVAGINPAFAYRQSEAPENRHEIREKMRKD